MISSRSRFSCEKHSRRSCWVYFRHYRFHKRQRDRKAARVRVYEKAKRHQREDESDFDWLADWSSLQVQTQRRHFVHHSQHYWLIPVASNCKETVSLACRRNRNAYCFKVWRHLSSSHSRLHLYYGQCVHPKRHRLDGVRHTQRTWFLNHNSFTMGIFEQIFEVGSVWLCNLQLSEVSDWTSIDWILNA